MYTVFVKCFHLSLEAMRVFREAMRGGEEEEVEKLPKQKKKPKLRTIGSSEIMTNRKYSGAALQFFCFY